MTWIIAAIFIIAFVIALGFYWKGSQRGVHKNRSSRELIAGFTALIESDLKNAIMHFKEAIKYDTNCIIAYIVLGELLSRQGSFKEATQIYNSLLIRSSISNENRQKIQIALAENYLREKNYKMASQMAKQGLAPKPSLKAYQIYLDAVEAMGNWDEAYQALLRMQKLGKDREQYKAQLACYKLEIGEKFLEKSENDKARSVFKEAGTLDPLSPFPMLFTADSLMTDGKVAEAVAIYEEVADKYPENVRLVFEKIEKALYELGDFQRITDIYRKLIKNEKSKIPASKALARIYYKMGDWERAIQTLSNVPNNDLESLILKLKIASKSDSLILSETVENLRKTVEEHNQYECSNCGNKTDEASYYCGKCGKFNTILG